MIDTSLWERDFKSQASGTRTKFWLFEPGVKTDHATRYLFKVPTEGTGGHWAEYVASKLGEELGFHTVEVKLAKNNGIIGTITKNFRAKMEEFYEGGDLFLSMFENFDRYSLKYYELPHILELLSAYDLENEFVSIPVFDALIANNDRHCDNWGILSGPKGYRMSPIYDNGSSLGFNEVDDKKNRMLTDNQMLKGFCNRGKPSIGLPNRKRPKHFELLSFLDKRMPQEMSVVMDRIKNLNEGMINNILKDISYDIMNDLNKAWIIKLLMFRKEWILNWYEGA